MPPSSLALSIPISSFSPPFLFSSSRSNFKATLPVTHRKGGMRGDGALGGLPRALLLNLEKKVDRILVKTHLPPFFLPAISRKKIQFTGPKIESNFPLILFFFIRTQGEEIDSFSLAEPGGEKKSGNSPIFLCCSFLKLGQYRARTAPSSHTRGTVFLTRRYTGREGDGGDRSSSFLFSPLPFAPFFLLLLLCPGCSSIFETSERPKSR